MDRIEYEILEDGTISLKTDAVSPENHVSADELLRQLTEVCGGTRTTKSRRGAAKIHLHQHIHEKEHGHTHDHA